MVMVEGQHLNLLWSTATSINEAGGGGWATKVDNEGGQRNGTIFSPSSTDRGTRVFKGGG